MGGAVCAISPDAVARRFAAGRGEDRSVPDGSGGGPVGGGQHAESGVGGAVVHVSKGAGAGAGVYGGVRAGAAAAAGAGGVEPGGSAAAVDGDAGEIPVVRPIALRNGNAPDGGIAAAGSPREITEYANLLLRLCAALNQGWSVICWLDQKFTSTVASAQQRSGYFHKTTSPVRADLLGRLSE